MEWYEVKVDSGRSLKFQGKAASDVSGGVAAGSDNETKLGGIINAGEWAWIAKRSTLQVVSLKRGNTISTFEFTESKGYDDYEIICVDQICLEHLDGVYLAVGLSCSTKCPGNSLIAFYSVNHSCVLSFTEMQMKVTCCRFISSTACQRSFLQNFDGCLALGSDQGHVMLMDINMERMLAVYENQKLENICLSHFVLDYNATSVQDIHRNFKLCKRKGVQFCLQLEAVNEPCCVQCLLPIELTMCLAIGLEDGRLVLYELIELQIFHIALPNSQINEMSPLVQMDFLEPSDDPRPCIYIWALHAGVHGSLYAVLHSLMYEKRLRKEGNNYFLETFQSSNARLTLPLENEKSCILSCQSIIKSTVSEEDDAHSLCAISWQVLTDKTIKLLIFDLNQWYKDEMPFLISADNQDTTHYLSTYILNGKYNSMRLYISPTTIAYFNSIQRFEEHFYPNSLSFDALLLIRNGCISYYWSGAQNRFINVLRKSNANVFLESETYFNEIMRTHLMPQFYGHNQKVFFSRKEKYEIILSVALEYNCFSLLRDCAKSWIDGSFTGNSSNPTGITLSLLTDWIWKRASDIKSRCNDLCQSLFNFVGFPLDQREQKELGFISRQLKLLANLLAEILVLTKRVVPEKVYNDFELKYKSLRMASEYQDVLLWLLNIGLLPEASRYHANVTEIDTESSARLVPYPYDLLRENYEKKRQALAKISDNCISKKKGNCRLLYIDTFIEHECNGSSINEYWMENNGSSGGNGLYPPPSIESMLRIILIPDMSYETKCAILLYFFLDLDMTINDEAYKNVVVNFIKFPSVFKLSASLIKTVQAFWNLDHGHFLPAVDEFLSPINRNQNYPQWLLDLLIEALLIQNASKLALRVLEAYSSIISPVLKLQALLANELFPEAFHFARSKKENEHLLEQFFKWCLYNNHFGVMRDLALNEKEDKIAQNVLKRNKTEHSENLHFVYLLQKSKYLEAVSYMDEMSKAKCMGPNAYLQNTATTTVNTPNMVLSAYKPTMAPLTQGLADVYFRIKNKLRKKEMDIKSPLPLSCQLIKYNANQLLGGIYHSSALSAHFATYYWDDDAVDASGKTQGVPSLLNTNNAPFLRRPQIGMHHPIDLNEKITISYPQIYKASEKRSLNKSDSLEENDDDKIASSIENPKKRRKIVSNEIFRNLVEENSSCLRGKSGRNKRKIISEECIDEKKDESKIVKNFLIQPPPMHAIKSGDSDASNDVDLTTNGSNPGLHGILKMSTPEPLVEISKREESIAEEESGKNLRFKLPAIQEDKEENKDEGKQLFSNFKKSLTDNNSHIERQNLTPINEVETIDEASSGGSSGAYAKYDVKSSEMEAHSSTNAIMQGPKVRKPIERDLTEHGNSKYELKLPKEMDLLKANMEKHTKIVENNSLKSPKEIISTNTPFIATSVMSIVSNIQHFRPQISSSKVCETQSKFSSSIEKTIMEVKLSEKSTCLDAITGITCYGSTMQGRNDDNHDEDQLEEEEKDSVNINQKATKELETTLGMSSYEFTVSEATIAREEITGTHSNKTPENDIIVLLSSEDEMDKTYSGDDSTFEGNESYQRSPYSLTSGMDSNENDDEEEEDNEEINEFEDAEEDEDVDEVEGDDAFDDIGENEVDENDGVDNEGEGVDDDGEGADEIEGVDDESAECDNESYNSTSSESIQTNSKKNDQNRDEAVMQKGVDKVILENPIEDNQQDKSVKHEVSEDHVKELSNDKDQIPTSCQLKQQVMKFAEGISENKYHVQNSNTNPEIEDKPLQIDLDSSKLKIQDEQEEDQEEEVSNVNNLEGSELFKKETKPEGDTRRVKETLDGSIYMDVDEDNHEKEIDNEETDLVDDIFIYRNRNDDVQGNGGKSNKKIHNDIIQMPSKTVISEVTLISDESNDDDQECGIAKNSAHSHEGSTISKLNEGKLSCIPEEQVYQEGRVSLEANSFKEDIDCFKNTTKSDSSEEMVKDSIDESIYMDADSIEAPFKEVSSDEADSIDDIFIHKSRRENVPENREAWNKKMHSDVEHMSSKASETEVTLISDESNEKVDNIDDKNDDIGDNNKKCEIPEDSASHFRHVESGQVNSVPAAGCVLKDKIIERDEASQNDLGDSKINNTKLLEATEDQKLSIKNSEEIKLKCDSRVMDLVPPETPKPLPENNHKDCPRISTLEEKVSEETTTFVSIDKTGNDERKDLEKCIEEVSVGKVTAVTEGKDNGNGNDGEISEHISVEKSTSHENTLPNDDKKVTAVEVSSGEESGVAEGKVVEKGSDVGLKEQISVEKCAILEVMSSNDVEQASDVKIYADKGFADEATAVEVTIVAEGKDGEKKSDGGFAETISVKISDIPGDDNKYPSPKLSSSSSSPTSEATNSYKRAASEGPVDVDRKYVKYPRNVISKMNQRVGSLSQKQFEGKTIREDDTGRTRGASVPPTFTKIENACAVLDSPSSRTRSRSRLNSIDNKSDDGSIVTKDDNQPPLAKRTRRKSLTNSISDQLDSTPQKRDRRNTISSSHVRLDTPRNVRARSVPAGTNDIDMNQTGLIKRKRQKLEKLNDIIIEEDPEEVKEETSVHRQGKKDEFKYIPEVTEVVKRRRRSVSQKSELNTAATPITSTSSYSSSRRLTRTQLAVLKRSSALTDVPKDEEEEDEEGEERTRRDSDMTLNTKKPIAKRRRSTNTVSSQIESDDSGSVASVKSLTHVTTTKRRITRSSSKMKDEVDDDGNSVASSLDDGRTRKRHTTIDTHGAAVLEAIREEEIGNESGSEAKRNTRRRLKH